MRRLLLALVFSFPALSAAAEDAYRALVHARPALVGYFHAATPVDEIAFLHLGSRPARRKAGLDIADLRAIPWVFAWTQSRVNLPAWYGLGTAVAGWAGEAASRWHDLAAAQTRTCGSDYADRCGEGAGDG